MIWILEYLLDVIILAAFNRRGRGYNSFDHHEQHNAINLWKTKLADEIPISCNQAIELLEIEALTTVRTIFSKTD